MRRTPTAVPSAATTVAALGLLAGLSLGLGGCSADVASPPTDQPTTTSILAAAAPPADAGPLPAPEALSDVMSRLADPAVSGADKLALIQNTAPTDGAALDRFTTALRDTGFTPVTVSASEIRWSDNHPGHVLATIKVTGPDPGPSEAGGGEFAFPMEFGRTGTTWQLTRETADMLLAFGNAHTDAPGPPPGPTPPS